MKFIRHETGAKAIPNVEFWTSIPGNTKVYNKNFINLQVYPTYVKFKLKAGFSFVVSKFRGNTYSQI